MITKIPLLPRKYHYSMSQYVKLTLWPPRPTLWPKGLPISRNISDKTIYIYIYSFVIILY